MSGPDRKLKKGGPVRRGRARRLEIAREIRPLRTPMRITGHEFAAVEVIVVTLSEGGFAGRGEAAGVYYILNDPEAMAAQIQSVRTEIENGDRRRRRGLRLSLRRGGGAQCVLRGTCVGA